MDPVPSSSLILYAVLILLSAFFSSSETALSSVNRVRMIRMSEDGDKGAKRVLSLVDNFDDTLSTILVGNNIVNIGSATVSTTIATTIFTGGTGLLVATFVTTILILIFGEILPKSLAKEFAEKYSLAISGILVFLVKILKPVTIVFTGLKNVTLRLIGMKDKEPSVTEEELKVLVDMGEEEGVLGETEAELVHSAFAFNDISVDDVLTPRIDILAVDIDDTLDEIKDTIFSGGHSRLPVYKDSIDNVIGVLSERDFLRSMMRDEVTDVRSLIRPVTFVSPQTKLIELLPILQQKQSHMAVVLDEFGGTAGLITLEDMLEELVGDIWDEHDESVVYLRRLREGVYECMADMDVDEFAEEMGIKDPDIDSNTMGGWFVELLGDIPEKGAQVMYEDMTFTVLHVEKRRVRKLLVETGQSKQEDMQEA
ncbi:MULTISPECIES: hemolysin family protein [unclassified Exiguobacterium]|uniref:hemolysin family protein n=1 Tax=unclassified Exiguobacterium TaxID=2644629 RepID=UPI001BEA888F